MSPRSWIPTAAATVALLAAPSSHGESRTVYRRATPIEARTGVVELRLVDEPIVDVPADCVGQENGTFGCRQERRFPRVYVLDFSFERRDSRGSQSLVEAEERGRVSLFLHFDSTDLRSFDDDLRRELGGLSADAFAESFGGLGPTSGVFSGIAARSREPSWSCFERGSARQAGLYQRHVQRRPDGTTEVTGSGWNGYGQDAVTDPLCEAGVATVQSARVEEIRTMPAARSLLETSVHVDFADGLRTASYPEDLSGLPADLIYTIERVPGVTRSESVHTTDGHVTASYTEGEVKISASASPASLDDSFVATNAWLARWTVEVLQRQMGPMPSRELVDRSELLVALLPTLPPVPLDDQGNPIRSEPPQRHRIDFDPDAFFDEIARRLDAAATIDTESLENIVADHPQGLSSHGWLMVVCRPGESADYRLLPTKAVAALEHAGAFCAAIERRLWVAGGE